MSDTAAAILPADVASARADRHGNALAAMYRKRTGHSLSKPALGRELVELIASNKDNEFDAQGVARRPVVAVLDRLVEVAALNHQPITADRRGFTIYASDRAAEK